MLWVSGVTCGGASVSHNSYLSRPTTHGAVAPPMCLCVLSPSAMSQMW